jgi:hypothetical protein
MAYTLAKLFSDDGQVQQLLGREEAPLLNAGVIYPAGENLGVLHYKIAGGKTWADVDAVIRPQ